MKRIVVFALLLSSCFLFAFGPDNLKKKTKEQASSVDSLKMGLEYLKNVYSGEDGWQASGNDVKGTLTNLVEQVELVPRDTLLKTLRNMLGNSKQTWVTRDMESIKNVPDLPGMIKKNEVEEQLKRIDRAIRSSLNGGAISVPPQLFDKIYTSGKLIDPGKGESLFNSGKYKLPDDISNEKIAASDADARKILTAKKDAYVDSIRKTYNDGVFASFKDSVSSAYRDGFVKNYVDSVQHHYTDSIDLINRNLLADWNKAEIQKQNEKVKQYVSVLANYLRNDSLDIWVGNLKNERTRVRLANDTLNFSRLWLKNEQNDSLALRIQPMDNRTLKLLIDDGVTFTRFSQKQTKDVILPGLIQNKQLEKFDKNYNLYSPWTLGGGGNVGFTQNYLSNWSPGGNSAMSILVVLNGFANCSTPKYSWENSIELRDGWMRLGSGTVKLQKNDDKLGLTSRFGLLSAVHNWYYSTEADFTTQFFNGYNYPNISQAISGFMAPGTFYYKLGMNYKPSGNLSIMVSPLTSKTVFVRHCTVNPTTFGLVAGEHSLWDPGLNLDVYWKKNFLTNVAFETKFKAFVNYKDPFSKYNVDWDAVLSTQLTSYINTRFEFHTVYDENVKFASQRMVDGQSTTIYRPKWQVQEMFTIGFSYKVVERLFKSEKELRKIVL